MVNSDSEHVTEFSSIDEAYNALSMVYNTLARDCGISVKGSEAMTAVYKAIEAVDAVMRTLPEV